ncbi:hypothetical protein SUGI_0508930 [Cryptomeria japonica]|nr:hypothetical protein SUGI_0508930 [Cryptomeria japonica]
MMEGVYSPLADYEVVIEKQAQFNLHDSSEGFNYLHCNTASNKNCTVKEFHVSKVKKAKPSVIRDFPPGCGRYASPFANFPPGNSDLQKNKSPLSPASSLECQNAFSSLQTPTCSFKSFVSAVKHPTRPVSSYRDFPFGCGGNAPLITKGECHKSVAATVAAPSIKGDSQCLWSKRVRQQFLNHNRKSYTCHHHHKNSAKDKFGSKSSKCPGAQQTWSAGSKNSHHILVEINREQIQLELVTLYWNKEGATCGVCCCRLQAEH